MTNSLEYKEIQQGKNLLRESIRDIAQPIMDSCNEDKDLRSMLMAHLHSMIVEYNIDTFQSTPVELFRVNFQRKQRTGAGTISMTYSYRPPAPKSILHNVSSQVLD